MKLLPSRGRHLPFYVGLAAAVPAGVLAAPLGARTALELSANAFFLVFLALTAAKLPRLTHAFLKDHASADDEPVWIIFAVTVGAVLIALGALFSLINASGQPGGLDLVLALTSVALGWLSIHTMASLHYAHLYWSPSEAADAQLEDGRQGGLDFPGEDAPSGWDFLYFGFTIGMTAQTSDIAATGTTLRRAMLLHSIVSYFFNTVLIAAVVNVAVSLGR